MPVRGDELRVAAGRRLVEDVAPGLPERAEEAGSAGALHRDSVGEGPQAAGTQAAMRAFAGETDAEFEGHAAGEREVFTAVKKMIESLISPCTTADCGELHIAEFGTSF